QITAAAQKYAAGFSNVTVVRSGLADKGSLAIYLAPPVVLPDDSVHKAVYLQLRDSSGRTVRANRDVDVHLASSNTNVGSVESDVTIPSGSTYGVATFQSTHAAGSTTITASAADFVTASTTMNVAGAVPHMITVSVVPTQLPSDGQPHTSLVLQLQDINGEPVNAPSDVLITLSSSKTDIGIVDETVVLPSGMSTTIATFYSTLVTGITIITASASGYALGSVEAVTVEPAPSNLIVTIAPSIIPAASETHQAIIIQLQDSTGIPARARYNIPISISSSNPSVGEADSNVILREGETYVKAGFRTSSQPGATTITALASGFAGSSSKLTTILYPLTLTFSPKEATVNVTDTATLTLSAKSSGAPVPDATVSWRTTIGSLLDESKTTDASGSAAARFRHSEPDSADVTVTVSKKGYQTVSGTVKISILPLPLRVVIPIEDLSIQTSKPTEINITVLSGDQPVQDATLSWKTTKGTLTRTAEKTDADGVGAAVFFSNEAGTAEINVTASKQGYVDASNSLTIDIQAPPVITTPDTTVTTTEQPGFTIFGLHLYTIFGLAAVMIIVIVVAVLFMIRRLRRRGGEELGEGELEELLEEE
ncbi:MAG: Ig-like domain-containing protein, partial [Nitrososphaerales archaeon]